MSKKHHIAKFSFKYLNAKEIGVDNYTKYKDILCYIDANYDKYKNRSNSIYRGCKYEAILYISRYFRNNLILDKDTGDRYIPKFEWYYDDDPDDFSGKLEPTDLLPIDKVGFVKFLEMFSGEWDDRGVENHRIFWFRHKDKMTLLLASYECYATEIVLKDACDKFELSVDKCGELFDFISPALGDYIEYDGVFDLYFSKTYGIPDGRHGNLLDKHFAEFSLEEFLDIWEEFCKKYGIEDSIACNSLDENNDEEEDNDEDGINWDFEDFVEFIKVISNISHDDIKAFFEEGIFRTLDDTVKISEK